jgi:hypothetical protein
MIQGPTPTFNSEPYLKVAQMQVDADEPQQALHTLNKGLPAWERLNPPLEILNARNKILRALMPTTAYLDCKDDSIFCEDPQRAKMLLENTLRGKLVHDSVKEHNEKGSKPHVIEMGPGEFWLPQGLTACSLLFTYKDIAVNEHTKAKSKAIERTEWDGKQPVIFCAQEVIEHLFYVEEMAIQMHRETNGHPANEVHLSTPFCVYDGKAKPINDLKSNSLPHLRSYHPQEFLEEAIKVFGAGYNWHFYMSEVMSLVGKLK